MSRSSSNISTGEQLLSIIDYITLISMEIIENCIAMKHQKLCGGDQIHLTELLVLKHNELAEQAKTNQKMDLLRAEVDKLDQDIQHLQRQLKEAEQSLNVANELNPSLGIIANERAAEEYEPQHIPLVLQENEQD